jgi:hypothetical protein
MHFKCALPAINPWKLLLRNPSFRWFVLQNTNLPLTSFLSMSQLRWRKVIIFDCITCTKNFTSWKPAIDFIALNWISAGSDVENHWHTLHVFHPSGSINNWCLLSSIEGQYLGPRLLILPLNIGERSNPSKISYFQRSISHMTWPLMSQSGQIRIRKLIRFRISFSSFIFE